MKPAVKVQNQPVNFALAVLLSLGLCPGSGRAQVPRDLCPLRVGDSLPSASLRDVWGKPQQVQSIATGRNRVFVLHRGLNDGACVARLRKLQSYGAELLRIGFEVIILGPDNVEDTTELVRRLGVTPGFRYLSDEGHEVAEAFGLAYPQDPNEATYALSGISFANEVTGNTREIRVVPAMYVVDKEDLVRFAHQDADTRYRLSPAVVLATAHSVREQDATP